MMWNPTSEVKIVCCKSRCFFFFFFSLVHILHFAFWSGCSVLLSFLKVLAYLFHLVFLAQISMVIFIHNLMTHRGTCVTLSYQHLNIPITSSGHLIHSASVMPAFHTKKAITAKLRDRRSVCIVFWLHRPGRGALHLSSLTFVQFRSLLTLRHIHHFYYTLTHLIQFSPCWALLCLNQGYEACKCIVDAFYSLNVAYAHLSIDYR